MANISLNLAPEATPFPFEVLPGTIQPRTAVPLARLTFQVLNQVIAAKIATNTTSISVVQTLPPNYAYTFEYVTANVSCITDPTDADKFDDISDFLVNFNTGVLARSELLADGISHNTNNAGSLKTWAIVNPYAAPIFNQDGLSCFLNMLFNDSDAVNATDACLFSSTTSVLQYEIGQVFDYPLNFPLPVSAR